MQTTFFQNIQALNIKGDLNLHIKQQKDGQLLVSILLANDKVEDEARKIIPPMNFQGTAKELDEGFFAALEKPIQKASALFTNMKDFEEALEKTKKQSKLAQEKEDGEKKEKEERKKKYEAQMKKVAELEEKKKYGEAIGAMPKPSDFPEQAEEIKKKTDELKQKHGQLELL
jgi:PRTRC genetic system protein E